MWGTYGALWGTKEKNMDVSILEKLAMSGAAMPENLPLAEQKFFQTMSRLYERYHDKKIELTQASLEKRQAYMALKREIGEDTFRDKLVFHSERVNRLTEISRMECRKHPTKEGIALCDAIDGLSKDDPARNVIRTEHGANCPVCNSFFNKDHASRKPRYCENCGCRLEWNV